MDGFKGEESIATYAITWKISTDGNYFEIIDDVEEVLAGLLVEVARSLRLEFPAGGIEEFIAGSKRVFSAIARKDFLTIISETVKLSVQVYKALPSSVAHSPQGEEDDRR